MASGRRIHWVDWLKVLAVFGVFVYHSAMVYAYVNWVIDNDRRSVLLTLFAGAGFSMGMPLLFLLSGAASFFALRKLGALRFADLRFRRLVVPLLAGLALLSPFQAQLARLSRGGSQPWASAYVEFLAGIRFYPSPRWLSAYGYHLWFLGFLFLYSLLALPFFVWLDGPAGRRFIQRAVRAARRPGGLLLFSLAPAAALIAFRPRFPAYTDWADFAAWLPWFAAGYLVLADPRFERVIRSRWKEMLAILLGSTAVLGALAAVGLAGSFEAHPAYSLPWALYTLVRSANTASVVMLVLALGIVALDRGGRLVAHLDEAVLPFYVLHHPAVVLVAYFVVNLEAGPWAKFLLQSVVALALTMAVYELAVRPFDAMRWVFGLRPRRPRPPKLADGPSAPGPIGPSAPGTLASA